MSPGCKTKPNWWEHVQLLLLHKRYHLRLGLTEETQTQISKRSSKKKQWRASRHDVVAPPHTRAAVRLRALWRAATLTFWERVRRLVSVSSAHLLRRSGLSRASSDGRLAAGAEEPRRRARTGWRRTYRRGVPPMAPRPCCQCPPTPRTPPSGATPLTLSISARALRPRRPHRRTGGSTRQRAGCRRGRVRRPDWTSHRRGQRLVRRAPRRRPPGPRRGSLARAAVLGGPPGEVRPQPLDREAWARTSVRSVGAAGICRWYLVDPVLRREMALRRAASERRWARAGD